MSEKLDKKLEGMVTKRDVLIGIYNEKFDLLHKLELDERLAQRMMLDKDSRVKQEAERVLGKTQTLLKSIRMALGLLFDDLIKEDEEL